MKLIINEEGIEIEGEGENIELVQLLIKAIDRLYGELYKANAYGPLAFFIDQIELMARSGQVIIDKYYDEEIKKDVENVRKETEVTNEEIEKRVTNLIKNIKQEDYEN